MSKHRRHRCFLFKCGVQVYLGGFLINWWIIVVCRFSGRLSCIFFYADFHYFISCLQDYAPKSHHQAHRGTQLETLKLQHSRVQLHPQLPCRQTKKTSSVVQPLSLLFRCTRASETYLRITQVSHTQCTMSSLDSQDTELTSLYQIVVNNQAVPYCGHTTVLVAPRKQRNRLKTSFANWGYVPMTPWQINWQCGKWYALRSDQLCWSPAFGNSHWLH